MKFRGNPLPSGPLRSPPASLRASPRTVRRYWVPERTAAAQTRRHLNARRAASREERWGGTRKPGKMEQSWTKNTGKSWENHRENMGKSWENHREIMGEIHYGGIVPFKSIFESAMWVKQCHFYQPMTRNGFSISPIKMVI